MLEYRVALLNVWWSKGEKNIRFFESVEEQSTYFDKMVGGQTSPLTNFNIGNNIETAITFLDKTNKTIEELVSSNYCVIYKYENGAIVNRRYFFAYPSQDSGRQMRVLLSLDDIQTNYIKYKKAISPCEIKRACLNRFKKLDGDYIQFNNELTKDNHLFEEENLNNFPKRVVERYSLTPSPDRNKDSVLSNWFKNNILGWQYIYLDNTKNYSVLNSDLSDGGFYTRLNYRQRNGDGIRGATGLICIPIYKTNKRIIGKLSVGDLTHNIRLGSEGLEFFKSRNQDESYFFASKFSILPPFFNGNFNNYYIEDDNLIFNVNSGGFVSYIDNATLLISGRSGDELYGCFVKNTQYIDDIIEETLTIPFQQVFRRDDIINSYKNYNFNPKLLSSKFVDLRVTNGNGEKFTYNLQKIGTSTLNLKYKEALTPDITRSMLYIDNGQYDEKNAKSYLGLINSFDNSLMQSNDQLSQFLAQNKNFHLQKVLSYGENITKSTAKGGWVGLGMSLFETGVDAINTSLTLDNLENSPDMLKNANGNAIFNLMASGQNLIVEIYECLPSEKEEANDFMVKYGFTYNHIDKLENVDNIRKRFNYIEADVETINAPISNVEKERLRDILKSIRFWNIDKVDYTFENYERWLEKYE